MLNNLKYLSEIPLTLADDPIFKQFFMDAEKAKLYEAELEAYYASKKAEWDKYAELETAKEDGVNLGIKKGVTNEKLAIAKMMKSENEPLEKIMKYTGLSAEEIQNLKISE